MSKIMIIGGGVSGLSAGILAAEDGYEVEIIEQNAMAGGECTGWSRQGFHIDNCIHFLTGCLEGEPLNDLWKRLGVLSGETMLYREPYFYRYIDGDVDLRLWRDLERARQEFLLWAPEDRKELNLFFDQVRMAECIKPSVENSPAHMNPFQFLKMVMSMKGAARANREYGSQTISEFALRFKNPHVRAMMGSFYNDHFTALTLVTSYAFFTSGTAAIPQGGSVGMVRRMRDKFESLGGKICYSSKVTGMRRDGGKIAAIRLKEDTELCADAFIWAADPSQLFHDLLGVEFCDPHLATMYDNPQGYVGVSGYQAAFGILTDEDLHLPGGSVIFPGRDYTVAGKVQKICGMRLYDYDMTLFPRDKRVIQCNILQDPSDYAFWKRLKEIPENYRLEKERVALDLQDRLETRFPQLSGKLTLLGTYTPLTFERWCGAYQGQYMSFNALQGYKSLYVKSTIKGVSNLFLGSQWLQNGGGLPIAAAGGLFALQQLRKRIPV